jgi:dTDP-4-dehydrorhamnose 3,5-epimerase
VNFRDTAVEGAFVIEPELAKDERGFFARIFSADAFAERGLDVAVAESSIAFNHSRGTLRGLHYQRAPYQETKLVRCTRGAVYDVAVDLRGGSPTFRRWAAVELSADNRLAFYIPQGCAHGYLTLTDDTELAYQISQPYVPSAAAGIRWDDPTISIAWPDAPVVISERDAAYADLENW